MVEYTQAQDKKEYFGNVFYELIESKYGEQYAPKITGMLLDQPIEMLLHCANNTPVFSQKVDEAYALIESEMRKQNPQVWN